MFGAPPRPPDLAFFRSTTGSWQSRCQALAVGRARLRAPFPQGFRGDHVSSVDPRGASARMKESPKKLPVTGEEAWQAERVRQSAKAGEPGRGAQAQVSPDLAAAHGAERRARAGDLLSLEAR